MASRLSEDPSLRVLLLERGGAVNTWASRVPLLSGSYILPGSPVYRATSEPLDHLDGRTLPVIRGEALGGGSRINGMGYTRSWAADFNRWSEAGRRGWSYAEVEPFFIKSEGNLKGDSSKSHGKDGNSTLVCASRLYLFSGRAVEDARSR